MGGTAGAVAETAVAAEATGAPGATGARAAIAAMAGPPAATTTAIAATPVAIGGTTAAIAATTVATVATTAVTAATATTATRLLRLGWYGAPYAYGGWGYTSVYPAVGATHGALDLDVSPESAQIYVDGDLVGTADDFDGFPDFLWLEKGTYDVVIFAPGFQTISRQYSVYGGLVIDVNDSMVPGQETLPQDLVSKSTVNREERLRRDRENEAQARAYEEAQAGRYESSGTGAPEGDERAEAGPDRLDARGEPGSLRLEIEPDDASVYLDGRFLGTGRELARLRAGLIVDPGEHRLEVVRPGRESEEQTFSVRAGEEVRLDIELDEE